MVNLLENFRDLAEAIPNPPTGATAPGMLK
jgi:hypothetical protein